jgi:hypothetical protein
MNRTRTPFMDGTPGLPSCWNASHSLLCVQAGRLWAGVLYEWGGMSKSRRLVTAVVTAGAIASLPTPAAAQETGLKGGFTSSRLQTDGESYWDERLTAAVFGGHLRFRFGPIALQPELMIATKGAGASMAAEEEQLRIEYLEVPVLLVVPARVGALEPFVYGGPALMLETRCRWSERQNGLRASVNCDPPRGQVFARNSLDYGLVGGGGVSYPIGAGRIMLEARHNWGLRNIRDGDGPAVRNRTFAMFLGYSIGWGRRSDDGI